MVREPFKEIRSHRKAAGDGVGIDVNYPFFYNNHLRDLFVPFLTSVLKREAGITTFTNYLQYAKF